MVAPMRPRFERVVPHHTAEVQRRLRLALEGPGAACPGQVHPGHAVVFAPAAEQRAWSPFLSLDIEPHARGSVLRGRFGPKPSIWSLFIAAYAACLFIGLLALSWAAAQWSLEQAPTALWGVPAATAGALSTYAFARYGQRRGREQMEAQQRTVEAALDLAPEDG